MEARELFTLRNKAVVAWLTCAAVATSAVSVALPPAFWLCALGVILVAAGMLSHSARTGQWYTSQRWEPRFNWFEGWASCTGAIVTIVPLLVLIAREWIAR
jgi:hypothetical protein